MMIFKIYSMIAWCYTLKRPFQNSLHTQNLQCHHAGLNHHDYSKTVSIWIVLVLLAPMRNLTPITHPPYLPKGDRYLKACWVTKIKTYNCLSVNLI